MENSYGVGTQNRFGLFFDEDGDPFDIVPPARKPQTIEPTNKIVPSTGEEKENKQKNKTTVPKKVVKIDNKSTSVQGKSQQNGSRADNRTKLADHEERNNRRNRNENMNGQSRMENGRRPEGERGPPRKFENNRPPPRRFEGEERPAEPGKRFEGQTRRFDGPPRRFNNEGGERRTEEGGRGRGRGMGGRGRGSRGGRREFDRHSGSERAGVRPVDKRDGSGSYNWGSAKDQIEAVQAVDQEAPVEEKEKQAESAEEVVASGAETSETKENEEPREMTLDEYKALQALKHVKPEFKVRKAGEGENSDQWKSTYVLKKKQEAEKEELSSEEETHHPKTKTVLDIDFQFSDSPMRGRGRGRGRGMGRGRGGMRGRGGGFNRTREQQAPKMDDEGDFPSLK